MRCLIRSLLFLVQGLLIAGLGIAQEADFVTVTPERSYSDPYTGDLIFNGNIAPLEQKMNNFYIRNADGVIEVSLEADAKIGLQSRVQRGGLNQVK
ncbi:MAG: hypothetical protein P8L85_02280 [Rubripirellula sp.]|nr:hypothetical protein [Rubripirellula sp.]